MRRTSQEPIHHQSPEYPDNYRRNIWQHLCRFMEAVIYVLIVLLVARHFEPELKKQRNLEQQVDSLSSVRDRKFQEVARLKKKHSNLVSDEQYLEAVARDRLNLQKDGEYIIRIDR